MYAADNPINRIDPSGLDPNCPAHTPEYCAWQRLNEIIDEASGDSFEALFRTFEDRELTERWWWSARRTSGGRLEWLLDETRSVGPFHFAREFGNLECSLNPLFRDQAFYKNEWARWFDEPQISNQVGHFLTAVNAAQAGWIGRRFSIGHEKIPDKPGGGFDLEDFWNQYQSVTGEDIDLWEKAIEADEARDYELRDDLLWQILSFENVPFGGVSDKRLGNSLQDLRLSLKGFRFNNWIMKIRNYYSQPRRAGIWLRDNLGNWQLTH
jgi:hypothetical protein